ncbi:dockerin type I domain-containing protein [Herbivorax sp. ANBcel31]|uniref:dockerin type I domain-containing protein n=1 Tax=Herbivorax sp. ANBcel31 TaxID=3069754 RepID=UPI0027B37B96|nr:dockerin type I domain-containing protein [Herbivorax sp. ANBcel31]MDQ2087754.1 dockerin type I domain-containing protein [Herbivorax sp. ANBcel31]
MKIYKKRVKLTNSLRFLLIGALLLGVFSLSGTGFADTDTDGEMAYESLSSPQVYGDLNGDGVIDSNDYVLLKRFIFEIIDEFPVGNLEVADLNGDGIIDSTDATLMSRYILDVIDEFPVAEDEEDEEDIDAISGYVDTNTKHQTIEGFGASIAFYQNWLIDHPNKAEIYDVIFDELGLSVLRLNNWYITYEDEVSFDPSAKEIVEEARNSVGDDLKIMMSSWSPPTYLKSNESNAGGTLKQENGEFVYDQFADFWYDSLKEYEEIGIVPDYISIQNEPDIETSYESCLFDKDENGSNAAYGKALEAVYNKLHTDMDNPPKILGPEVLGIGYNNFDGYMSGLNIDHLDGLAFHLYHGGDEDDPDSFNNELENINNNYPDMPKYQTEFYRGNAFNTAWIMHNSLTKGNVSMYLYWDLIWEHGSLVTLEFPWDNSEWTTPNGYIVTDKYYALKQYSKFIKPGYTRVDASMDLDDIKISAYICPDEESMSVVLLNTSSSSETVALDFDGFLASDSEVYRTSDDEKTEFIGSLGEGNTVYLPSQSIATVVIQ